MFQNGYLCYNEIHFVYIGRKKLAFLDLIIEIAADPNSNLSDEDLRDEVHTFIGAVRSLQ